VYANDTEQDYEKINDQRYNLLGQQMSIYKEEQISWSIWLYKDIGFQGMSLDFSTHSALWTLLFLSMSRC
jgi:hypothetical protein